MTMSSRLYARMRVHILGRGWQPPGFSQIDRNKQFKDIFIIGTSHRAVFDGASIYNLGDFITPLGKVEVDVDLADKLIKENPIFAKSPEYHDEEHRYLRFSCLSCNTG